MRRLGEAAAFLALASAVHAGAWVALGREGTGDGGAAAWAPIAIEAADPQLAALVAAWQRPPEVAPAPSAPPPALPASEEVALAGPRNLGDPPAPGAMPAPAQIAAPEAAPRPDTLPAPVPATGGEAGRAEAAQPGATLPAPTQRPRPRPERLARPETPARPESPARPAPQPARSNSAARQALAAAAPSQQQGATLNAAGRRALEAEWGARILARVAAQQRYPANERVTGTAHVTLSVRRDGGLAGASLSASSGHPALDRAALDAVRRAGRFPPAPEGLDGASYSFRIPMTFRRN